jgi:hypothetical protein
MTSTFRIAAAALAALAISAPASAQERRPRLGIGVGINTFDFNTGVQLFTNAFPAAVPDSIYVPINIAPSFRLEPQLGIVTFSEDTSAGGTAIDTSVVSIGLGVFYVSTFENQLDVYVGGRVVRTSFSQTQKTPNAPEFKTEGSDIRIIPALGGEYSLHPRFSLGAEVQLQLISFGSRSQTAGGSIPGGTGTQTSGLFFARVYLF